MGTMGHSGEGGWKYKLDKTFDLKMLIVQYNREIRKHIQKLQKVQTLIIAQCEENTKHKGENYYFHLGEQSLIWALVT